MSRSKSQSSMAIPVFRVLPLHARRCAVSVVLLAACQDEPAVSHEPTGAAAADAALAPIVMNDATSGDAAMLPPMRDAASGVDATSATTDAAQPVPGVQEAGPSGDAAAPSLHDAQAAALDAAAPMPIQCPASASLAAGDHKESLSHQGRTRTYLVHVPKGHDGSKPAPLVLDFHGYSRTSAGQKSASGWDVLSDREGILVVYPDGVGSSWNVGGCCGSAGTGNVDDVGFARAIVAKLVTQLCVDTKRVYASGVSNGAGISARLGCDAADVFAGVALVSSDLRTQPCVPKRAVTEIAFRGTGDTLEPYEGGLVGPVGMQFQSPGARGSFELWKNINRCSGTPAPTAKLCETYTQCAEGVEVTLCTMPGVGHSPYDNDLDFNIAQTSWDAFKRVPAR